MFRDRIKAAFVVAASLAAVLAVQPVAAATVTKTTGTPGLYAFQDDHDNTRGADCVYEDHKETHGGVKGYWLDQLRIRGPKIFAWDNGSGTKQWVGWKYKVQSRSTGDPTGPWHDIYVSSVTKKQVTIAAGYQFPRRTWSAPDSFGEVNLRVLVILTWYKRSGSSTVQGTVKASYDYYHVKGGGQESIRQSNCYRLN